VHLLCTVDALCAVLIPKILRRSIVDPPTANSRLHVHWAYEGSALCLISGKFLAVSGEQLNFLGFIILLENILTDSCVAVIAAIGFLLLVDFPQDAHKSWKFLTETEAAFVIRRIEKDRHNAIQDEEFNLRKFLEPASDPKVWAFALIFL
jgi:hypothetical protein